MKSFDFKKILGYFKKGKGWEIVINILAVLLVALVAANIYIFRTLETDTSVLIQAEIKVPGLRRDLLGEILDNLKNREERFSQGILTKPDISDPSL